MVEIAQLEPIIQQPSPAEEHWYAVHTRSRHEQAVYERLKNKSIYAFLPKIEVWSARKDRQKRIQVPMFRGYLFIRANLENRLWLTVLQTPGVARIISSNGKPVPIPENQIASIQTILENDTVVTPYPYLNVGERVRIVAGPLRGVEGILLRFKPNKQRLILSVDLLQQSVCVELNTIEVEPINF
ncbi:MAG: UpxY family transcription antiterminator [bacterium]|nr:UpxY family transcription antiterminator [bacterium]